MDRVSASSSWLSSSSLPDEGEDEGEDEDEDEEGDEDVRMASMEEIAAIADADAFGSVGE